MKLTPVSTSLGWACMDHYRQGERTAQSQRTRKDEVDETTLELSGYQKPFRALNPQFEVQVEISGKPIAANPPELD